MPGRGQAMAQESGAAIGGGSTPTTTSNLSISHRPSMTSLLEPFHPEIGKWSVYQRRLEQLFIANDVSDDSKRKAILLTALGGDACDLLWDLFSPDDPFESTVTYGEICAKLTQHFVPTKIEIAERFRFYQRKQNEEETIVNFVAALRNLSKDCQFGSFLNSALRDAFVIGLVDSKIQMKLLSESALTLDTAVKIATSMEAATQQSKQLRQAEIPVHQVRKSGQCWRCGDTHGPDSCRFRNLECYRCKKRGHRASKCTQGRFNSQRSTPQSEGKSSQKRSTDGSHVNRAEEKEDEQSDLEIYHLPQAPFTNKMTGRSTRPLKEQLVLDGKSLVMEIDTGAGYSLISEGEWHKLGKPDLRPTTLRLVTYTGEPVRLKGEFDARVTFQNQEHTLPLYVAEGNGRPSLCGRNWLRVLRLDWAAILQVEERKGRNSVRDPVYLKFFQDIFDKELGTIQVPPVHLDLQPGAVPKFFRPRPIPYALRDKVQQELLRMVADGILEPVDHSDWGAPIVVVVKPNGALRICGDFKVTINPYLHIDQYPLPVPEDIFATLEGGCLFSKLDLSQAYLQLELDEESKKLCTMNTPFGLFRSNRMAFGIASAPGKFQRVMDDLFRDLPWVKCYLDDILVAARSKEEHDQRVIEVLRRLQRAGVRLSKEKCLFGVTELTYLGFVISKDGLKTSPEKVKAIQEAQRPHNLQSLRAYLGLVNYYGKFVPKLAQVAAPLYQLLKKEVTWKWEAQQEEAWAKLKALLSSAEVLCSYNPSLPLSLACDASPMGVAAVLAHRMPDGSERPIAYASKALSAAEKNYSQLDKEALAIIFGVKRFHSYLYGRTFTLITDHKPLLSILGPKAGIPPLAAARMQRWALILAAYNYNLEFRKTEEHGNADALSRFPLASKTDSADGLTPETLYHVDFFESALTVEDVKKSTQEDALLQQVKARLLQGWRREDSKSDLVTFYQKRDELTWVDGVIVWGRRVVIPKKLRPAVLSILHESHAGIVRMKALARSYVWWPGLDQQIEEVTKSCQPCLEASKQPARIRHSRWPIPEQPWTRLHMDFAGPVQGKMLLILMDATTKWPEVVAMDATTSGATIEFLRSVFSRFGHPQELVSDNGPQFTSAEFQKYMVVSGIKHLMGAPYHPQSNGLAERAVQTVKAALLKMENQPGLLRTKLLRFLINYRNTPHSSTGRSPAVMLLGRPLRTRLDLLKPAETSPSPRETILSKFRSGQAVLARDFRPGQPKWQRGTVERRLGSYLYLIRSGTLMLKRHVDQLRSAETGPVSYPAADSDQEQLEGGGVPETQDDVGSDGQPEPIQTDHGAVELPPGPARDPASVPVPAPVPAPVRFSSRDKRMPIKLKDYVLNPLSEVFV